MVVEARFASRSGAKSLTSLLGRERVLSDSRVVDLRRSPLLLLLSDISDSGREEVVVFADI
jgi:hypothetical protein